VATTDFRILAPLEVAANAMDASKDGTVRFWSLPDGRVQGAPLRFPYGAADAQLSPNGRWLSVVPLNRAVVQDRLEIWDVRRRQRVTTVRPAGGSGSARFSPDGRLLAVPDLRGRVQVFSTATWKPITPSFAGGRATWVAFNGDGSTLATGNTDGTVRLWDVASGQALGAPLPGVPNSQVQPIFTPDRTHLIAGYQNGRAYRWDIRPASLIRQACQVAGRRLTREEWDQFLPGRKYEPACSGHTLVPSQHVPSDCLSGCRRRDSNPRHADYDRGNRGPIGLR
jgi:WD40 repeat protein